MTQFSEGYTARVWPGRGGWAGAAGQAGWAAFLETPLLLTSREWLGGSMPPGGLRRDAQAALGAESGH